MNRNATVGDDISAGLFIELEKTVWGSWLNSFALERNQDFKIGGKVIKTTKYIVDLMLLAK